MLALTPLSVEAWSFICCNGGVVLVKRAYVFTVNSTIISRRKRGSVQLGSDLMSRPR